MLPPSNNLISPRPTRHKATTARHTTTATQLDTSSTQRNASTTKRTTTTGQAHWELLLRARAVENQCHVIAPAQAGLHENGRRTWGNSMVIDPWGDVLAVLAEGEGVVLAEVSPSRTAAVRQQLPALNHRRL